MSERINTKLKLITKNDQEQSDSGFTIKYYREDSSLDNLYLYYDNTRIRNSLKNSIYKPIRCSELYYKINKYFKWFQYKYLVLDNDNSEVEERNKDIYLVTKDVSEEYRNKPIYELNSFILENNKDKHSLTKIDDDLVYYKKWNDLLDSFGDDEDANIIKNEIEKMVNSNEIYLLNNSKSTVDFLSNNTSFTTELIKPNTYTDTVDLKPILSDKIFWDKVFKLDISIKYSIGSKIHCTDTTISGISIDSNAKKVVYNNFTKDINNEIKLEYLNGIIKIFPVANNVSECIISNCLITYGN